MSNINPCTALIGDQMKKSLLSTIRFIGLTALIVSFAFVAAHAQTEQVPQRDDIDPKYKWNLEDIYTDTVAWNADFAYAEQNYPELKKYEGKLGESAKTLAECLALRDTLNMKLGAMYVYSFMKYHEDTRVSFYQELQQRITALNAQIEAAIAFIEPEILTIPDDKLKKFLKKEKTLMPYEFEINDLIRSKAHILSSEEESILALAAPVTQGFENIYDMIYLADVKFPKIIDENGDSVQISRGRFSRMMESQDRDFRRRAHKAYNEAYEPYYNAFGATLASSVNSDWFYTQARKYETCLDYRLDNYNIPKEVYENLVNAVNDNLEPLHKYVTLRKKVMGLDELHNYDLSVPLLPEAKKDVEFDQATATILKGLKPLGDDYISDLKEGFAGDWIDVYETEGKYSGGYCWGTYVTHPFILLNYNNSIEEMFTVAHEMGHALHRNYSYEHQPYPTAFYTIFVAEVASTVNEAILIDYLLDQAKDEDEKLYLLTYYIEQILGTFYYQVMFSEFEKAIHDVVEQGGALSSESMQQIYTDIRSKYWGPELVKEEYGGWGGLRVSHFYRSYYVYQYATSYAAAQLISAKILSGDKDFRDKYLEFLGSGGGDYPVEQLRKLGVDMTDPQVINNTLEIFDNLVDQADKLFAKRQG